MPEQGKKSSLRLSRLPCAGSLYVSFLPLSTHFFTRGKPHGTFCLEAAGIVAFGLYWLVKTKELSMGEVEHRASSGALTMNPHTWR
jgi:hypothetical protein